MALFVGALTALVACIAGAGWARRGEGLFGLSLVGMGTPTVSLLFEGVSRQRIRRR
jgi:hypothetical protein